MAMRPEQGWAVSQTLGPDLGCPQKRRSSCSLETGGPPGRAQVWRGLGSEHFDGVEASILQCLCFPSWPHGCYCT